MLRIHAIQTKEVQKQVCELCSVEFIPDALAYAAYALLPSRFKFGPLIITILICLSHEEGGCS